MGVRKYESALYLTANRWTRGGSALRVHSGRGVATVVEVAALSVVPEHAARHVIHQLV